MPPSPSPELVHTNVYNPSSFSDDDHWCDAVENDGEVILDKDKNHDGENIQNGAAEESCDSWKAHNEKSTQFQPVTLFEPLSLSTIYDGKPFAELVRSWETYIGDHAADQFQPILNNICGAGQALSQMGRPKALESGSNSDGQANLSEPFPLRHIQSTPLVHTHSILDDDEDEQPPIGLEILSRSRSTPLTTSVNSAFGIILRPSLPDIHGQCDRSAFTLPPYRLKPPPLKEAHRNSVFNPINANNDLETTEQTAIEVMNVLPSIPDENVEETTDGGTKTTSRAAQFLSDVRNLGRRIRARDGRENPAQPTAVSEEPIINLADPSGEKETKSLNPNAIQSTEVLRDTSTMQDQGMSLHIQGLSHNSYATSTLDYRSTEIPVGSHVCPTGRVRIQVTNGKGSGESDNDRLHFSSSSPEPTNLANDGFSLTSQSHDSPETFRSSGTTFTSGHTTQATATTYSSGQISHLSVISETDLEVIQVNRAGQVFRSYIDQSGKSIPVSTTAPGYPGYIEVSDNPSSLRDGANNPTERFFTMAESPIDKRGISIRARSASSLRRSNTVNSPNTVSSSSMTTNSSGSVRDEPPKFVSYLDRKTTSDLTSLRETDERSSPRQGESRLRDERGSSPAELVGYSDVTFEEAQAPLGSKARPRPIWPTKGFQLGRKVRSLPPRSPHKGSITPTTPPPRGGGASPCFDAVSPPRHIVDHRIDPNVSRPFVLRSTPPATRLLSAHKVAPEVLSAHGSVSCAHIPDVTTEQWGYEVVRMGTGMDFSSHYYMTRSRGASPLSYQEQGIEVQKADSKEDGSSTS